MKILFGFSDVLALDAWLAFFESKGHEVDGAMSAEDLLGVAGDFRPDILVTSYNLNGELDGLGLFYELSADPITSGVRLILVSELGGLSDKGLNKKFIQSGGVLGVIHPRELSFEAVEELIW